MCWFLALAAWAGQRRGGGAQGEEEEYEEATPLSVVGGRAGEETWLVHQMKDAARTFGRRLVAQTHGDWWSLVHDRTCEILNDDVANVDVEICSIEHIVWLRVEETMRTSCQPGWCRATEGAKVPEQCGEIFGSASYGTFACIRQIAIKRLRKYKMTWVGYEAAFWCYFYNKEIPAHPTIIYKLNKSLY